MQAWEALDDRERLTWDVRGSTRRMKGINYFKQVNLRRLRRGEALTRVPPQSQPYDGKPLLKGLDIRNRVGRITLELELWRVPSAPRTVWGSLPSNLGLKQPDKCPRLGWLPAPQGRWVEITELYFNKHGEYKQVKAVVPTPEVQMGKKAPFPSKPLRNPFVTPSNPLRTITGTTRAPRAPP